ncbi:MAG TPA: hypothetical protein VN671_09030 [Solirubrobacterales bacterium]|nr:hypothetical protein [Solirubrobacterales bacterium]
MRRALLVLVGVCLLFVVAAPVAAAAGPFEVTEFDGSVTKDPAGDPDTQAGSHPYAVSTTINFSTEEIQPPGATEPRLVPSQNIKDVDVELPAGLIGDPSATPLCTAEQLAAEIGSAKSCPADTQVGTTTIFTNGSESTFPVWNMVPPPGVPAEFGFVVLLDPVTATATVRSAEAGGTEGYGLDIHLRNISQGVALTGTALSFWGNPSDPRHNEERGNCLLAKEGLGTRPEGGCPYTANPKPFMTLPTSCTGQPSVTHLTATAWNGEVSKASFATHGNFGEPLGTEGCDQVPFGGSVETSLGTPTADSPSSLGVDLKIPQNTNPEGLATANLKKTVVTLPAGISINPSTGNGLIGCSVAQFDQFGEAASTCPQNSKIGTVEIKTPLIEQPIAGGIYLARQAENPFGSLIAIYLIGEAEGVRVKLPGEIALDPTTGRLVTTFDNTPQVPFSDFKLNFFGGPSAVLATPVTCGTRESSGVLTPWSGGADVFSSSQVTVSSGPTGCFSSPGQRPFALALEAGTESNAAATHSPYDLLISRADGNQEIGRVDATLPLGVLPVLKGVPLCSDADANAGTCGAASQVGTVTVGAGAGTNPFYVRTGRMYLTGPYKGAPYGLDFVVPAVAGPLDLGTVSVRAAGFVDPTTAQVTIKADELPHILDGIPLRIRSLQLDADRPGFIVNPTSCDPLKTTAQAISTEGATTNLSDRFQAADCAGLGFKPKVAPRLLGGRKALKRRQHPSLQVTVTEPRGQANLSKVSVAMPAAILLDQSHIKTVCTRVQFAAEQCPAASIYGKAKVTTPLLDQPLEGPVYLRSSSNKLPDLVVSLKGQIGIVLDGRIESGKKGGIRTVFTGIPDAPISKFTLTMKGGKKGLLENSKDLCKAPDKATVQTTGQNGAAHDTKPALAGDCGGGKKKKKK